MEHTIEQQKMESLEALARLNMEVSEARNALTELQNTNQDYLKEREKEAIERVNRVLEESESILKETMGNYASIKEFHDTLSSFSDFLWEGANEFAEVVALFEDAQKLWSAEIDKQQVVLADLKQGIEARKVRLDNEQATIAAEWKRIGETKRQIHTDRGEVERMINRLKEKRV